MSESPVKIVALVGPTAIGKTELSLFLARELGAEIISMDSMQIYQEMEIGTAKPTLAERAQIPHHLVDFVPPDAPYDASDFVRDAGKAIGAIRKRDHLPLLVGGTGLYLRALLDGIFTAPEIPADIRKGIRASLASLGNATLHAQLAELDPPSARRIHANDSQRLCRALEIVLATGTPWSTFLAREAQERGQGGQAYRAVKIGLERPRQELYQRINQRVEIMVEQGLRAEVEGLLAKYSPQEKALQAIGYRHMVNFLQGEWAWDECLRLLARDTRRYAKRQLTWFGRDPEISWFHPDDHRAILQAIREKL
ncbi:MAG: tRNA (adenosine(37)-N6)-dimethylallyltransferase MiaA [Thermodesulfobacteriota bacterium]